MTFDTKMDCDMLVYMQIRLVYGTMLISKQLQTRETLKLQMTN
jgi:hypothetical protein